MSDIFQPQTYIPGYAQASEAEVVQGAWVHPRLPPPVSQVPGLQPPSSPDTGTIIMALSAGTIGITGDPDCYYWGIGACYFGPGNRRNKAVHIAQWADGKAPGVRSDQGLQAAVARAALHTVGKLVAKGKKKFQKRPEQQPPEGGTFSYYDCDGTDTTPTEALRRVVFKVDSDFLASLLSKEGRVRMRRSGPGSGCWLRTDDDNDDDDEDNGNNRPWEEEDPMSWLDAVERAVERLEADVGVEVVVWRVSKMENAGVREVMDGAMWEIDCIEED